MSDDSMNWEIVFDARIGSGMASVEQRLLALQEAQQALIANGVATDESFATTSDKLGGMALAAASARDAFRELDAQMSVLGGDRLQNVSGAMDAIFEHDKQRSQDDNALLKAWMLERERLISSALTDQTTASRLTYNASTKIDNTAYAASKAIPASDTASQEALGNAAASARTQVESLTKAFEDEGLAAAAAEKEFTPAEQAGRLEALRQGINDVTIAYTRETDAIKAQAKEAKAAEAQLSAYSKSAIDYARATAAGFSVSAVKNPLSVSTLSATESGLQNRLLAKSPFNTSPIPPEVQASYDQFTAKVRTLTATYKGLEEQQAAEARALYAEGRQIDAQVKAYEDRNKALEVSTKQQSLYNEYLATQAANTARQVKAQDLAANPVGRTAGLGNFYPLIVAAGIFGGLAKKVEDFGLASGKMAAEYQQAFASVARTSNTEGGNAAGQIDAIRKSLEQLDTQIPLSFADLSKIATAGNEIGVSSAGITGFTKTVAEYSQVTGTAADATATAFGSLGQILKIPATEYENFGSAVSLVGRKSVATEAQVLSMTAKIGATAHQANFTTSQILGLAGSLASLQEAPERSQGALEIYFKTVNSAAATGGAKLQEFANAVHMSASAAQEMIKNNPYGFLLELLKSIGNQKGIVAQTTMLQGLGLSATRVSEVLRRLSTNTDLLGHLTDLANQGYVQGTDLSTQYAKATDTLSAKFKELQNAFNNFLATVGGSGLAQVLTGIVDGVKDIVMGVTGFAQAAPVFMNLVVAFAAVGGALLALRAISLGATIATIALESAQVRLQGVSKLDGLKTLTSLLFGVKIGASEAEKAANLNAIAQQRQITAMIDKGVVEDKAAALRAMGEAELMVSTDAKIAAGGIAVFKGALMTLGIPALLIGITALATTLLSVNDTASNFDSTGLENALKADQSTYASTGQAIKQISVATEESKTSTDGWVSKLNKASGAQADLNGSTQTTTKSIEKQTIAYGDNAKAALKSAIANDDTFKKIFSDQKVADGLGKVGFDPARFAKIVVNDPTGSAGKKYVQEYVNKITASLPKDGTVGRGGSDANALAALDVLNGLQGTIGTVKTKTEAAAAADAAFGVATGGATQAAQQESSALEANAQVKAQTATETAALAKSEDGLMTTLFAGVNAFYAQTSALSSMGQEYINNGAAAAFSGASFQAYIKSVIDADPSAAADNLTKLRNSIVDSGYAASATAPELSYLNAAINQLGGQTGTTAQATDTFPAFINGLKQAEASLNSVGSAGSNASDGLAKTAKQIITVTDYASNLSSTFKEAFDIRFGKQQGLDDISTQFQTMKDNANSARKSIQDAKNSIQQYEASISKTRADNANQKYFLSVAQQFGDSSRANDIQAQIDSNNASIAGDTSSLKQAQLDLAAAEDKLNTSYTGNTAGAIANRAALEALAQKYEDYITKLAASGASQKTLEAAVRKSKEEFDKQATSLGYTKDAIQKVDGAFSDMATVIKKMPPANVSITGLSAGEAAMKNFMAKLEAITSSGTKNINNSLKGIHVPELTDPNSTNAIMAAALKSEIIYLDNLFLAESNGGTRVSNASLATLHSMQRLQKDLITHNWNDAAKTGYFYDGGYTGPGGKYQPAGIVHKGEYVVPADKVNQSTGLPYADALGRLISGAPAHSSYASGGFVNSDMMVTELGPRSLGVLRQLVNSEVVAVISAQNLTGAVNATNSANRRRGR